jgi:L-amino acid N-acyltransferase YncA
MTIRTAQKEDLPRLVEIYNQAITAGEKTAETIPVSVEGRKVWFENHPPDKYPILVYKESDSILGYLEISAYRPGRLAVQHTAEASVYIHFSHHRRGIASALVRYAVGICPSLQIKTLIAIVLESNRASIRQLEKFGFERWGFLPDVAEFGGKEVGHLYLGLRVEGDVIFEP